MYMADAKRRLQNNEVMATAGYNAGPGRARNWQASTPLEGAIYAETIPFTETRDYVKKSHDQRDLLRIPVQRTANLAETAYGNRSGPLLIDAAVSDRIV